MVILFPNSPQTVVEAAQQAREYGAAIIQRGDYLYYAYEPKNK